MRTVREGSVCTIRARFFNDQQVPAVPQTARYRLRDVTNNRTIVDWTDVTPDSYIDVPIDPESNSIHRDSVIYQENALVVQADVGLATQWTDEVRYQITNLKGYQS
jgi:hypothetical protein